MPRRQFVADLDKAQKDALPHGITDLNPGLDDGQIEFFFTGGPTGLPLGPVKLTALIPDLSEYPKSHYYMIFGDDDTPRDISSALQHIKGTARKSVSELLNIVSTTLSKVSLDRDGDSQMPDTQSEDEDNENGDESDTDDSDHEALWPIAPILNSNAYPTQDPCNSAAFTVSDWHRRQRIRSDLRTAKAAGFKVGVLGYLLAGYNAYASISIRISKLGISAEAMQAWQIEPADYLILIIQYPNGYRTNEELQAYDTTSLKSNIAMQVVAGKSYKPSLQEAINAFTTANRHSRSSVITTDLPGPEATESSIRDTFISQSLKQHFQEMLIPILRFRNTGMTWQGAEDLYRYYKTATNPASDVSRNTISDKSYGREDPNDGLPQIVNDDHCATPNITQFSFPLLAMQFTLRHFVRCTEFCLICCRKMTTEAEVIKPYVCDGALCLFLYLSMGFGPSIEHELLAQPYVVDLLVSFCYNSCAARKLKDFPLGLSLLVPSVDEARYNAIYPTTHHRHNAAAAPKGSRQKVEVLPKYDVGFDQTRREIIFYDSSITCPVRNGDWILLTTPAKAGYDFHCCILDASCFPAIKLRLPVAVCQQRKSSDPNVANPNSQIPVTSRPSSVADAAPGYVAATFEVYEQEFDALDSNGKCLAICRLLDTLPTVLQMQQYLAKTQTAALSNWSERISPSALALLRWIIASNRSCIMQVDSDEQAASASANGQSANVPKSVPATRFGKDKERCFGMKDYMQFRFAMGAPDKEQRFITEVRNTTARLKLQYPTIFAWHGSPLANWHMIIREGLHYKNLDHGRAFGDGVYHAKDASTSTGYSGFPTGTGSGQIRPGTWPSSVLRISAALALNEIVNAPGEFQSNNPHYVVKQLDWIQTRYLFVLVQPTSPTMQFGLETKPKVAHPQDPQRTPKGLGNESIIIPASAIKSSKTARKTPDADESTNPSPFKKLKLLGKAVSNPVIIEDDDDGKSVATDTDDLTVLFDEDPEPEPTPSQKAGGKIAMHTAHRDRGTDFTPGTLNFNSLPIMLFPEYASSSTTKHLMKELMSLRKFQELTPAAELGWYIDAGNIENVYQWIVELHSFHTFEVNGALLPLSTDMKKKDIKSIVLEVRFNKDFPFTPPYVRVIRPRCLSLAQGGGGHIVMGGAMCMELLTNTGWSSVLPMESVLMQIRMAIASEPFARIDLRNVRNDYGIAEAAEGYIRACQNHGWAVPPGFKEMAYGKVHIREKN